MALTIHLTYPDSKSFLLTNIYRSNGPIANLLLSDLNATNKVSYVFLDANIKLSNLHLPDVSNYMNTILENGFFQKQQECTMTANP